MSRVGIFGQISEINDHLFLSGAGCIKPDKLKQKKISCIVNATIEEPSANLPGVDYIRIRVDDNPYAPLSAYFDSVADKIRATMERGGRTLVHCMAGVSRSASLVMVYLVKHEKMSLRQAYHHVKGRRPVVRPNVGFWKQMVEYEKKLRGTASIQMMMTPQCDLPIPDVYVEDLRKMVARENATTLKTYTPATAYLPSKRSRFLSSSSRPASIPRRTTSPHISSGSLSSSALSSSALLPMHAKYSIVSPAPTRKPRETSLFSLYASSPRHFFSAL